MIHFVLLISRQGKVRLTKWYSPYSQKERSKNFSAILLQVLVRRRLLLQIMCYLGQAYFILDEILIAGELQESSKRTIARLIDAQDSIVEIAKEQASSISNMIAQVTK